MSNEEIPDVWDGFKNFILSLSNHLLYLMFMKVFSSGDVLRWISFKGKLQSVLENWKINHKNEKKTRKF